eukprot:2936098-Prymnesium_polylepis.1
MPKAPLLGSAFNEFMCIDESNTDRDQECWQWYMPRPNVPSLPAHFRALFGNNDDDDEGEEGEDSDEDEEWDEGDEDEEWDEEDEEEDVENAGAGSGAINVS